MTSYEAVGIAEGFIEAETADQVFEAWQLLIDTGLAFSLQRRWAELPRTLSQTDFVSHNEPNSSPSGCS